MHLKNILFPNEVTVIGNRGLDLRTSLWRTHLKPLQWMSLGMALRSLGLSFLTCKLKVTALIVFEPVKRFWMSLIGAANKKTIIVL